MTSNVVVGKYTLESLTTGMYTNPFIIYREYIQNSADAIDEAVRNGLNNYDESYIKIFVNEKDEAITIEDNGMGISAKEAVEALCNIGKSAKNPTSNKGFRGIGRLGGLSYCDKVIFETSYKGENCKTIISFDAVKLSSLLIPGKNDSLTLSDVINQITKTEYADENEGAHYFKVTLLNVNKKFHLVDIEKINNYLKQVAPVPFDLKKFENAKEIYQRLNDLNVNYRDYNVYLGTCVDDLKQVYKPYKTKFYTDVSKKIIDDISGIHFHTITNDYTKKLIAIVWYGKCKLLGTVLDDDVKGLRVRKSDILIGDRFLLSPLFKEERFNGWIQGEVIVLDDEIIANARRDDLEKNDAYLFLTDKLKVITETISNDIRNASRERNVKSNPQTNVPQSQPNISDSQKADYAKTKELINKLDLIIDRATANSDSMIEKVCLLIKEEIDSNKADKIIQKIRKQIACVK